MGTPKENDSSNKPTFLPINGCFRLLAEVSCSFFGGEVPAETRRSEVERQPSILFEAGRDFCRWAFHEPDSIEFSSLKKWEKS